MANGFWIIYFGDEFGAIWEASGTTLASIWMPGAVPGAAWKWSGLGRGPQAEETCPGSGRMLLRGGYRSTDIQPV